MRFISVRWFKTGSSMSSSLIPAASGIAIGVCALIVIIGIMNGFQMGFIEAVLELDGYHLRLDSPTQAEIESIKKLPGIQSVLPFSDTVTLALNVYGTSAPVKIKTIPVNAAEYDPSLSVNLAIESADLNNANGVIIGSELARKLDCGVGDSITLLSVTSTEEDGLTTTLGPRQVTGIFHCGYLDFDEGLVYQPFALGISENSPNFEVLGIKLKDRYADSRMMEAIRKLGISEDRVESWRTYNQAFFGALRMEKTIMILLVGLIFLVVGVNIFHAMRKSVFERIDDIAILKALGGDIHSVRSVFVINGFMAGVGGAFCGLAGGLFIALNVNNIFMIIERGTTFLASLVNKPGFSFFSKNLFYIADVPVRLVFFELVFIVITGAFSAVVAAWVASSRVTKFKPSEVLRHE